MTYICNLGAKSEESYTNVFTTRSYRFFDFLSVYNNRKDKLVPFWPGKTNGGDKCRTQSIDKIIDGYTEKEKKKSFSISRKQKYKNNR